MMAHTPYALEVKEFYEYAEDVAWKTHITMDLIALNKETLANSSAIKK